MNDVEDRVLDLALEGLFHPPPDHSARIEETLRRIARAPVRPARAALSWKAAAVLASALAFAASLGGVLFRPAAIQDPNEDGLKRAVERYENSLQEVEESFVELGPDGLAGLERIRQTRKGDLADASGRAIGRIKDLQPRLEGLVRNLGADSVDVRAEAERELVKAGRAARPYLEKAARSTDRETAARARAMLAALPSPSSSKEYWQAREEREHEELVKLRAAFAAGVASKSDLQQTELSWLKTRVLAGRIGRTEYLKARRTVLADRLEELDKIYKRGLLSGTELLEAKLYLAYVDRRLGKPNQDELFELRRLVASGLEAREKNGLLSPSQAAAELQRLFKDPDEDLDR